MYGNFSPDAIEAFTEAVGEENFSEGLFDFTRCIRSDGSAYGTSGKCRKGTEGDPLARDKNTAREMRKGLVERVKSHTKMANETTDSGAKEFYKGEARTAAKKLKTLGRADKTSKVAKALTEKGPSAKERQANPGKETFDKGVRDRRENRNVADKPKEPKSDGPARAAYLKQTLENEMNRQNRPEIVAGLKKKLAEAEGKEEPSARKTSEKGSLAPDRNAWKNREELDKYTKDWQQRNGLDDVSQKHDRFHSAVHSFLGRSSEDFARASGIKGITSMEEILVNHVNQHITESDPGERISSRKNLLDAARSMKESFIDSGEIKRGSKEDRNWDRSAHQAARIFEVMSKRPDFDEFVSQLQKFPNPYDE
jgi:hypothetical protein